MKKNRFFELAGMQHLKIPKKSFDQLVLSLFISYLNHLYYFILKDLILLNIINRVWFIF